MLTIGMVAVLSAVLVVTCTRLVVSQTELLDAYKYQEDASILSNTMTQSSEDLTNSIRLYAMTGNQVYRDDYFRVATEIEDSSRTAAFMKLLFIASMSILVVVVAFILVFLSRSITGNLKRVVQVIEKIAAGDISDRLVASARNEFGFMATSINTMADTIGLVVGEARMLSTAAVEGRLATRSDAGKFRGGFHDIVEGGQPDTGCRHRAAQRGRRLR
jgi:methyl-accepting chemotaxis protein